MYRTHLFFSCLLLAILCLGSGAPRQPLREGKDYAVFFAIDDYESHPDFLSLRNPISDALSIARELQGGYAFSTVVYHNPDRATIQRALDSLKRVEYAADEQLFLFFSGHGDFEKSTKRGTFVASGYDESAPENNKIDLAELRRGVEAIDCSHLLLAMDACYSGLIKYMMSYKENKNTLSYGGPDDLALTFEEARETRISELLERNAKLLITSTVNETSADGLEYSPFTQSFLEALKKGYNFGYGVINHSFIASYISLDSPKSFDDALAGDEGGNFIFVVSNPDFDASASAETNEYETMNAAEEAWRKTLAEKSCEAYQAFHEEFPESDFSGLAWKEIKACNEKKAWNIAKRKNTSDAYQYFIYKYPESVYVEVARDRMQNIPLDPAPNPNPGTRPGRLSIDPRSDDSQKNAPPKASRPPVRVNPGRVSGQYPSGRPAVPATRQIAAVTFPKTGRATLRGQTYNIVQFAADGLTWMADNLNYNVGQGSYCYNNSSGNCKEYGRLYTWQVAKAGCSALGSGWRLPTDREWRNMAKGFGGADDDASDGGKSAYKALIVGGKSGFSAQLGGDRYASGSYLNFGAVGGYWSGTEADIDRAWSFRFSNRRDELNRYNNKKEVALSVRCVKN